MKNILFAHGPIRCTATHSAGMGAARLFPPLNVKKLAAKCTTGEIKLPLVRLSRIDPSSQKSPEG